MWTIQSLFLGICFLPPWLVFIMQLKWEILGTLYPQVVREYDHDVCFKLFFKLILQEAFLILIYFAFVQHLLDSTLS